MLLCVNRSSFKQGIIDSMSGRAGSLRVSTRRCCMPTAGHRITTSRAKNKLLSASKFHLGRSGCSCAGTVNHLMFSCCAATCLVIPMPCVSGIAFSASHIPKPAMSGRCCLRIWRKNYLCLCLTGLWMTIITLAG